MNKKLEERNLLWLHQRYSCPYDRTQLLVIQELDVWARIHKNHI